MNTNQWKKEREKDKNENIQMEQMLKASDDMVEIRDSFDSLGD